MRKSVFGLMIVVTVVVMCTGCAQKTMLFNGKDFTGWKLHVGDAGDFVLIGHTGITVGGKAHQDDEEMYVSIKKKYGSNEKPPGKWNTYDIYCEGDSILVCVNGRLQNAGRKATDTEGWICLQSEGSPIEFRNIYIEPKESEYEIK